MVIVHFLLNDTLCFVSLSICFCLIRSVGWASSASAFRLSFGPVYMCVWESFYANSPIIIIMCHATIFSKTVRRVESEMRIVKTWSKQGDDVHSHAGNCHCGKLFVCVYQKHIETTSQIIVLVCSGSSTEIHHVAEYGMSYYHAQHELVLTFSRMRQRAHVLVYLRSNLFINCRCSWWFMVSFGILQCFPINCMSHHTNSRYNPHALPADRLNGSWFNDDAS